METIETLKEKIKVLKDNTQDYEKQLKILYENRDKKIKKQYKYLIGKCIEIDSIEGEYAKITQICSINNLGELTLIVTSFCITDYGIEINDSGNNYEDINISEIDSLIIEKEKVLSELNKFLIKKLN